MTVRTRPGRPPGPAGRRLTGNVLDYDLDRLGFLREAQRRFGDCFSFDATTVVISDPDVVHDVFVRTNSDFLAEGQLFAGPAKLAHVADVAQEWMIVRRHGWRGFHRSVATAHGIRLVQAFDRTLSATNGVPVDVNDLMQDFSGTAVADYCLGANASGVAQVVGANVRAVLPLLDSSTPTPRWLPARRTRQFLAARNRTEAIIAEAVRDRRQQAHVGSARDLLDQLIGIDDPPLPDVQILDFIRVNLLASFGVPGASLSWIVRELARRPDVLARTADEARVWHGPPGTVPTLAQLPYTGAPVKEMLRAYPPTWLMGRIVARPTTLDGWHLRAGDQVMFSPYLIHRDSRWWVDPDRIDPDRWLGNEPPHPPRGYLPFGAGPRTCLGTHLGTLQLVLATSWMVHAYRIEVDADPGPLRSPRALLIPDGLRARFLPRPRPRDGGWPAGPDPSDGAGLTATA